jgi:hypothetical protein
MKRIKTLGISALLTLVLISCGGGGGGGDGVILPPPPPLAIDQNNAMQVAAAVLDTMAIVLDLGSGSVVPPVPVAAAAEDMNALMPTLAKVIRDQAERSTVLRTPLAMAQIAAVVIPTTSYDCMTGTFTISGEIADETGTFLTPGDSISITFNNCDEGDGVVLNGKLALVVVTGVDTDFTPPYDFTFDTTLTNFSVTESGSGESFTANGDLTLREAVTADGLFTETEASGNKLTATVDGETETLKDYWIRGTLSAAADAYTAESSGLSDCCATLESTVLGGTVDFENIARFMGVGDSYPYAGDLFITGANVIAGGGNSSVELIAVDELCVDLLVDENGDGMIDAGITTTWESLPTGIPADCVI